LDGQDPAEDITHRELHTNRTPKQRLGSFRFDANGDPTVAAVAILQANQPASSASELDTIGTNLLDVIPAKQPSMR